EFNMLPQEFNMSPQNIMDISLNNEIPRPNDAFNTFGIITQNPNISMNEFTFSNFADMTNYN
ncbi:31764_t:CDS:1, partial [Racocetra persica]